MNTSSTTEDLAKLAYLKNLQDQKKCEDSFAYFAAASWHIVEPGRNLDWSWHIDAICEHLEAAYEGRIRRLIICAPPRSMKSTLVSILFPAWVWLNDSSRQFLSGSHLEDLQFEFSDKTRLLLASDWFQKRWGDRVQLRTGQDQKKRFELIGNGGRTNFGMAGGVTGRGGDFLIIDDPHNAKKAMFSATERQTALKTFDQELSTRLNDPKRSAIIINMQRLNIGDLAGHVQKSGKWCVLSIPFRYEAAHRMKTSIGWEDPRKEEGAFYWPERFGEEFYEDTKKRLGSFGVAAQLQQRPIPLEGGLLKPEWVMRYDAPPPNTEWDEIVQFWDTAQKGNELLHDPWVCITAVRAGPNYFALHVYRDWHNYPEGRAKVIELAERWKQNYLVIEDKSTGQSLLQELPGLMSFPCLPFEPEMDKVARFAAEMAAVESGRLWLPQETDWLPEYEGEIFTFPASDYKDQADATSMMLKWWRERWTGEEDSHRSCPNTEGWPEEGEDDWSFPLEGGPLRFYRIN